MVNEKPNQDLGVDKPVKPNVWKIRPHYLRFVKLSGYFAVALLTTIFMLNYRTASESLDSSTLVSSNVNADSVASPNVPSSVTKATDSWHVYTAPDKSFSVEVPCDLVDHIITTSIRVTSKTTPVSTFFS